MKKWVEKHPIKASIAGVVTLPFIAAMIICIIERKLPNPRVFDTDQWASLLSGALAYVGTCFVGILAVWQNIRFKRENDKATERLEQFNERLLRLEEYKLQPIVIFEICSSVYNSNFGALGAEEIILDVKNAGASMIKELSIKNIFVGYKDKKYRSTEEIIWKDVPVDFVCTQSFLFPDLRISIGNEFKVYAEVRILGVSVDKSTVVFTATKNEDGSVKSFVSLVDDN